MTFKGKVIILKSLVISKLIYTAQVLSCPMEWIKAYEKLFYNFVWGNRAKVKKENMINTLQNGGMNMVDMCTQFISLRIKWLFSFLSFKEIQEKKGKWIIFFEYWIEKLGGIDIIMNCKCLPKYVTSYRGKIPDFYCDLLCTWFTVKRVNYVKDIHHTYGSVTKEMIWLNCDIKFKGKALLYTNWIKSGILFLGDIVIGNRFLTVKELKDKLIYYDGRWLSEYAKIRTAIQQRWRRIIKYGEQVYDFNDYKRKSVIYSNLNLNSFEFSIHSITVKKIYTELIKLMQKPSRAVDFWNNTLQTNFTIKWDSLWLFKLKYVRDNYLIQFNFKFMYNILPTPVNLFKWKIKENNLCYYCNKPGTIIHVFF